MPLTAPSGSGGGSVDVSELAKDTTFQPISTSGTITAQNTVPAGVAPAGSAVELATLGRDTVAIQVTGVYTGVLSVQYTVDGTTWVTASGAQTLMNKATGAYTATIASAAAGIFITSVDGVQKIRVTGLAAVTGTATVSIRAVDGNGMLALDNALPAGAAVIGAVTQSGTWTVTGTPAVPTASSVVVTTASLNLGFWKATAGSVFELSISNLTAATIFVKLYNKATAPVVASDVPVLVVAVAANSSLITEFGALGKRFGTGIAYAVTGAAPITDATNTTAGALISSSYI